jgi:UDP-GlcNAc:undecaprenyl-phosphate GlcNAc-1-phosphate transferase
MSGLPAGHELAWLLVAAVTLGVATEAARRLAWAIGFVVQPNPIVRSHRSPVPYLGGVALVLAYLALLAGSPSRGGSPLCGDAVGRGLGALAFAAFGTCDDVRALPPAVKLLGQLAICGAYLALTGEPLSPGLLLKLLVLTTLVNAYNLIDVMDGLLCLLASVAALGLLATPDLAPLCLRHELALGLVGVGVIFLFNCPPARVYLGDAGSQALGFLIGSWCLAAGLGAGPLRTLSLAGLCAVPLLELALLVPARLARGSSPFRGSPDHFALRLQDQLRWSKWQVLTAAGSAGALFALAPWLAARLAPSGFAAYVLGATALAAGLWYGVWRIPPHRTG